MAATAHWRKELQEAKTEFEKLEKVGFEVEVTRVLCSRQAWVTVSAHNGILSRSHCETLLANARRAGIATRLAPAKEVIREDPCHSSGDDVFWFLVVLQLIRDAIVDDQLGSVVDGDGEHKTYTSVIFPAATASKLAASILLSSASTSIDDNADFIDSIGIDPNAFLSCSDLAKRSSVNPGALRKRLDRARQANKVEWLEVSNPGNREPRYLYLVSSAIELVRKMTMPASGVERALAEKQES